MVAVMLSSSIVAVAPVAFPATVHAQQIVYTGLSKPVSIENKGTIELKTIFAVPSAEGQVVTFTLDVVNNGKDMIDFNKYWLRINTKDGKKYPMRWVDQSKNLIYPGQRQTILFYTILPKNMSLSDVKLRLVKWDTSIASFERDLGELPINASIIPTLGRSLSKFIGLTNNQIEARVELGGTIEDSKQKTVNYYVKLMNKGQYAFTLPDYQYIIVTNTGIAYPLTVNSGSNSASSNQLLPWIEEEVGLTGIVPSTVDLNDVAVYILHPHGGDKGQVLLPVTVFRAFDAIGEDGTGSDGSIEWGADTELILRGEKNSDESKTSLVVTSIQRFPWDHRDILSAQVKLINTGETTVSIPQLMGQFVLGDGFKVNAEVVQSNSDQMLIHPGSSITYQAIGYISYASSFRDAYIELKENNETGYQKVIKSGRIPHITFTERDTQVSVIDLNKSHVIGENTGLSTLKFGEVGTYKSVNGKYVVTRVVVTNLEQRSMKVPQLKAYYRTKQGIIYPATISDFDENNFPRGASVISFYAEFPEEIKQEELQLIVGEKVNDKGIKDGVAYQLNEDTTKIADRIDTIYYYPYTLKFSSFFADEKGFTFNLKKEKSFNSIANLGERRLIMEYTDMFGDYAGEHEVIVEGGKAWDGKVTIGLPNTPSDDFGNNVFTVTIYDVYKNSKKALAKQTFYIYRSLP